MKPDIRLTQEKNSGDLHRVSLFFRSGGMVIRRNVLTKQKDISDLFGPVRQFGNKYYCKSETVVTYYEIKTVLRFLLLHPRWVWKEYRDIKKTRKMEEGKKLSKLHRWYERVLPVYIPDRNAYVGGWCLAIWNCGMRPQSFRQALKDTRITIRKNGDCKFVIKKGDYEPIKD